MVIEELKRAGTRSGTVVDLECGSGIMARLLSDAGYEVVGIDLSEPLLRMARKRVPEATFRMGSFATTDIHPCVAVTAIGEVFNYTFDTANCAAVRAKTFGRVYTALAPRGLLVFDMAGPARAPSHSPRRNRSPRSLNQGGSRESFAVCNEGLEKKLERVPSLKDARSFLSQQARSQ